MTVKDLDVRDDSQFMVMVREVVAANGQNDVWPQQHVVPAKVVGQATQEATTLAFVCPEVDVSARGVTECAVSLSLNGGDDFNVEVPGVLTYHGPTTITDSMPRSSPTTGGARVLMWGYGLVPAEGLLLVQLVPPTDGDEEPTPLQCTDVMVLDTEVAEVTVPAATRRGLYRVQASVDGGETYVWGGGVFV